MTCFFVYLCNSVVGLVLHLPLALDHPALVEWYMLSITHLLGYILITMLMTAFNSRLESWKTISIS